MIVNKILFLNLISIKVIYFDVNTQSATLPYLAAGIRYTPNLIYVGQIMLPTLTLVPVANQTSDASYGFLENSTISVNGSQFSIGNYVFKVPPNTVHSYTFQSSRTYKIIFVI